MARIFIVHLRRPQKKSGEMRSDPFWEFGSFGCTSCHGKNLLRHDSNHLKPGDRLGFAQGGDGGFRLVFLTPPITLKIHGTLLEVKWKPIQMPFRYERAPLLIANKNSETYFPKLKAIIKSAELPTWERKFSSRFRTRCQPLEDELATELVEGFENLKRKAKITDFATIYVDALPYPPPCVDSTRRKTYLAFLKQHAQQRSCSSC